MRWSPPTTLWSSIGSGVNVGRAQVNTLTGSHGLVASMYPRYEDRRAVHRQMNSTGVFDSPFSKRVGIAEDRFTP